MIQWVHFRTGGKIMFIIKFIGFVFIEMVLSCINVGLGLVGGIVLTLIWFVCDEVKSLKTPQGRNQAARIRNKEKKIEEYYGVINSLDEDWFCQYEQMSEMVEAATSFKKSGFSDEDSATLATISSMFANVADGAVSASESADFLISQMIAFGIEADNAISIVDKVNEV